MFVMAPNHRELIELWDRADRVRQETSDLLAYRVLLLEASGERLCRHMAEKAQTRDLIEHSKELLKRSQRGRAT